jgi:hypothetical protein
VLHVSGRDVRSDSQPRLQQIKERVSDGSVLCIPHNLFCVQTKAGARAVVVRGRRRADGRYGETGRLTARGHGRGCGYRHIHRLGGKGGGRRGERDGNDECSSDLVVLDVRVVPNAGRGSCGDKVATAILLHDKRTPSRVVMLAACMQPILHSAL